VLFSSCLIGTKRYRGALTAQSSHDKSPDVNDDRRKAFFPYVRERFSPRTLLFASVGCARTFKATANPVAAIHLATLQKMELQPEKALLPFLTRIITLQNDCESTYGESFPRDSGAAPRFSQRDRLFARRDTQQCGCAPILR